MKSIQSTPKTDRSFGRIQIIRKPTTLAVLTLAMWVVALVSAYNNHVEHPTLEPSVAMVAGL